MPLNDIEVKVFETCCSLNDNLTLNVIENDRLFVYKSRFLSIDFKNNYIIIDEPSPETPDAKPLSRGQYVEIFFQYKIFRYLFSSKILAHTTFKLNERKFHALQISIPRELKDGDMREYFRVQTGMRPPVLLSFYIYKKGSENPIMSPLLPGTVEEYHGEMVDISGGGFSMRSKPGEKSFDLEKGDTIQARFKLKMEFEEMNIWAQVRNIRRYTNTNILIWGFQFLGKEKNPLLHIYQSKILRYVTNRQREILSK